MRFTVVWQIHIYATWEWRNSKKTRRLSGFIFKTTIAWKQWGRHREAMKQTMKPNHHHTVAGKKKSPLTCLGPIKQIKENHYLPPSPSQLHQQPTSSSAAMEKITKDTANFLVLQSNFTGSGDDFLPFLVPHLYAFIGYTQNNKTGSFQLNWH